MITENGEDAYSEKIESGEIVYTDFQQTTGASITPEGCWYIAETSLVGGGKTLSYGRFIEEINTYLVIETTTDTIDLILSKVSSQNGAIAELAVNDFVIGSNGESLGISALVSQSVDGEVTYEGNTYLCVSTKVEDSEITITTLIPKQNITDNVARIKEITIVISVLLIAVSLILGLNMSKSISKEIKGLCKTLQEVVAGDFTARYRTKSKNEFRMLSDGFENLLKNIRDIFVKLFGFNKDVIKMADEVALKSSEISTAMYDIGRAQRKLGKESICRRKILKNV